MLAHVKFVECAHVHMWLSCPCVFVFYEFLHLSCSRAYLPLSSKCLCVYMPLYFICFFVCVHSLLKIPRLQYALILV